MVHLTILLFVSLTGNSLGVKHDNNQVVFSHHGRATREAAYSHMIAPLPIKELEAAANDLYDLCDTIAEVSGSEKFLSNERYGIERIMERIQMIISLVSKQGYSAAPNPTDSNNTISWALRGLPRNKRSAIPNAILGLAAFGHSLYTQTQLSQIFRTLDRTNRTQDRIVERMESMAFRIMNITQHIEQQHHKILTALLMTNKATKTLALKEFESQVTLMVHSFRFELSDFLMGLSRLTENRLSPFLIRPAELVQAYTEMTAKAREAGLHPLTNDAGIMFQAEVSMLVHQGGNLSIIVHIPLYNGEFLNVYQYHPAPMFFEDPSLVMEITSPALYLALDTHHTVARQFTAEEFKNCKHFMNAYHCPQMNVLSKKTEELCLFNLFTQNTKGIEATCRVTLSKVKNHVAQLSASQFRLLAIEPVQLVKECLTGNLVEVVQGVIFITLNETCPCASTPSHYLVRTSAIHGYGDVVHLPLLPKSREWLTSLVQETSWIRRLRIYDYQPLPSQALSLQELKEQEKREPVELYNWMEGWVQTILMYVFLLWIVIRSVVRTCRWLRSRMRTKDPGLGRGTLPSRELVPGVRYPSVQLLPR